MDSQHSFNNFSAPMYLENIEIAASVYNDGADEFFDTCHSPSEFNRVEAVQNNVDEPSEEDKSSHELGESNNDTITLEPSAAEAPSENLKKSNENDLLSESMANLDVAKKARLSVVPKSAEAKSHTMETRRDKVVRTPTLQLRSRTVVRNMQGDQEGVMNLKRKGSPILGAQHIPKYISLAEQVLHFQKDTPPRFRASKRPVPQIKGPLILRSTIPHSPHLTSHLRARPITVVSQRDKEDMEFEDIKMHQVKALPLNKNIFEEPKVGRRVEVKVATKPEPFNLTEVTIKKPVECTAPYKFTARPVPRAILESTVGLGPKNQLRLTVPETPKITASSRYKSSSLRSINAPVIESVNGSTSIGMKHVSIDGLFPTEKQQRKTSVQPFSFEERDKNMLQKKEEKIKQFLEEEKKARNFQANPLPSFKTPTRIGKNSSTLLPTIPENVKFRSEQRIQMRDTDSAKAYTPVPFKARPSTVLLKKPFEVKKSDRPLLEVTDIQLHTERRAKEREEFEMKQKEKEAFLDMLRKEKQEEKERQIQEEIAKQRQEAVHRAIPVPLFKPMQLLGSTKPLTIPQSPNFSSRSKSTS